MMAVEAPLARREASRAVSDQVESFSTSKSAAGQRPAIPIDRIPL
jgi:hypothetical protein